VRVRRDVKVWNKCERLPTHTCTQVHNPTLVLLGGALEYHRSAGAKLSSLDNVIDMASRGLGSGLWIGSRLDLVGV